MISKKIGDFAKTISFEIKEDSAFGFVNNLLVSVYEKGVKKSFFIYYTIDSTVQTEHGSATTVMTISGKLQDIFKKYNITDYSVNENGLEVSCSLSFKDFYAVIKQTTKILSSMKAIKNNVCSQCEQEINMSEKRFRISQNMKNYLSCASCAADLISTQTNIAEEETASAEEKFEGATSNENDINFEEKCETEKIPPKNENTRKLSTLKGIAGALLTTFGCIICFVLLYAFAAPTVETDSVFKSGYYVNWFSATFAICAVIGYKLFSKETIKNKQLIISGIVSAITVFIAQYISSIILFLRELLESNATIKENASLERYMKAFPSLIKLPFTDNTISVDFKIYFIMDIIFILIALLVMSLYITPKSVGKLTIEEL